MKPILSVLVIALISSAIPIYAQNKGRPNTDKVTPADFNLPASPAIDSNTNAVVLFDIGSTHFEGNKVGSWVSYVFTRHTRIKFINKKDFDMAVIRLYLFGHDDRRDIMENLQAASYNLENGKVIETKLNTPDIFEDRRGKNILEKKFTFPNLKEGAIIDYSYKITSYRFYAIPEWSFQKFEIPTLYSEFEIGTPDLLRYLIAHHGRDSFFSATSSEGYGTMNIGGTTIGSLKVSTAIHNNKWVMKNIPGFKPEAFLNGQEDFLDKLEFHLIETYNGEEVRSISNWESVTDALLASQEFGLPIDVERLENLSAIVANLTADDINQLDAARHVYNYIRDNITSVPDNDIYIDRNLYNINKGKQGNVADLNMLLIAMLRLKGINATPVLLSTRDYGRHPVLYPVLQKMNYLICMMKLGSDVYYLDASNANLGFGKLPLNCYNGHARVISKKDSGNVYFYPDAIKELAVTTVFIQNDEKVEGNMSASIQYSPGYFESTAIRSSIKKINKAEFAKQIKNKYFSDLEMTNIGYDSIDHLDLPVKIHYDVNMKSLGGLEILYFNPMLVSNYKNNPFKAENRQYPVEMDYPLDEMYVLNMEIPAGYVVDEIPKSAKVAFNENEGFYEYMIQKDETSIQLRCRLKLNHAVFSPDEYNSLRDFFGFVVKKENELITFKKKK